MNLWLLRHAQVDLPPGLCYGITDAPALAGATAGSAFDLAEVVPARPTLVWMSGLQRTHQLAHALRRHRPDLPAPEVDVRLNEMNFGRWEQQPWDDIPRSAFDDWMADFAQHRFGGLECTQAVIDRVAAALADTREALAQVGGSHAVWVTHAGVIRAAQFLRVHGHRPVAGAHEWPQDAPAPGGWTLLRW